MSRPSPTLTDAGSQPTHIHTAVQHDDFDVAALYAALVAEADNPGAVVFFTGLVREVLPVTERAGVHDGAEQGAAQDQTLTLEHYPGMTEKALHDIAEQAVQRWPLQAVRIIHRVGTLRPRDQIVVVGVASAHRQASFEAAEFIMDYLKVSAPFWKKQQADEQQYWVESRDSDYTAAQRWQP